jgi:hypothetical protein
MRASKINLRRNIGVVIRLNQGTRILLPLALTLLFAMAGQETFASGADASKATELLARSLAANTKCKILSSTEQDELQGYVARAELALAEQQGLAISKATLERGRSAGQAVACDATTTKAVQSVVKTAREVVAQTDNLRGAKVETRQPDKIKTTVQAPIKTPAVKLKPVKPIAIAKLPAEKPKTVADIKRPKQIVKTAAAKHVVEPRKNKIVATSIVRRPAKILKRSPVRIVKQIDKPSKQTKNVRALGAYQQLAENYYVELRCRQMSKQAITRFYGQILRSHKAALGTYGAGSVAGALRNASNRASGRTC